MLILFIEIRVNKGLGETRYEHPPAERRRRAHHACSVMNRQPWFTLHTETGELKPWHPGSGDGRDRDDQTSEGVHSQHVNSSGEFVPVGIIFCKKKLTISTAEVPFFMALLTFSKEVYIKT